MAEDRGSPARVLTRPRALATSAPGPDELRRAREVLEAVAGDRSLLAQLPARERRILVLRFFHGMTQTQISEEVGISQMHVSRLLAKSLAVLREGLLED